MTAELFLGWFKKFIKFSEVTVDRPVLLLLDGHRTHTQNIDVIIEARFNYVYLHIRLINFKLLIPATPPPVVNSQVMRQCEIEAEPQPGCSTWMSLAKMCQSPTTPPESVFSVVSPQQMVPYPATRKMIQTINRKKLAEDNKKRKREAKEQKNHTKTNSSKKTIKKSINNSLVSPPESDNEENNIPCFYCLGKYFDSDEGWVPCSLCGKWVHCSCAGIDDEDDEATFACEFCN
nr:unnamed protein product [Callosobruchus analis]